MGILALAGPRGSAWRSGAQQTLRAFRHRSTALDVQLLIGSQLLRALGALPAVLTAYGLAALIVGALDGLATPSIAVGPWAASGVYTIVLFVVWDLSRYAVHRLMHEVPALWAIHQVHHSAEVLTPLTFHRVHPVESMLYAVRDALVTGVVTGVFFWLFRRGAVQVELFGVSAIGFVLNAVTGNLRHSHVFLSFGPLERWLVSPAQHQLHHGLGATRCNYGTWIAVWDRLGGSLVLAERPPERFGVDPSDCSHGDDLVSAWLGPFRSLFHARSGRRRARSAHREPQSTSSTASTTNTSPSAAHNLISQS